MKVLFVCYANVFRSQIAEAYFRRYGDGCYVESAGTRVSERREGLKLGEQKGLHVGRILEVMKEDGFDLDDCRSQAITPELVESADTVICMTPKDTVPDYLERSGYDFWDVEDASLSSDRNFFVDSREKIKGFVERLIIEIC